VHGNACPDLLISGADREITGFGLCEGRHSLITVVYYIKVLKSGVLGGRGGAVADDDYCLFTPLSNAACCILLRQVVCWARLCKGCGKS
jgi:hypothetical protein